MKLLNLQPKKKSHIARIRESDLTLTEIVQKMLGWSDQQYCDHQFNEYLEFIDLVCESYPKVADDLRYSELFRGFWNNEWIIRNQQEYIPFAADTIEGYEGYSTEIEYKYIHSHLRLIDDMFFMHKYECILKQILKTSK